jgi:decaprenylphospho-beta-D-ribofuranose 2-oxidase
MTGERRVLTGWGRTAPSVAQVRDGVRPADVQQAIGEVGERGLIARGLGRSYGDAAQNGGGEVLVLAPDDHPAVVNEDSEVIEVSAGTSVATLIRELLPQGWVLPVLPGTRYITVGGALAADVHGKNHHVDGSFGRHVRWLELVDGRGELRWLDPSTTPDLFWATIGGMGLTGVIVRAAISVRPVETSWLVVDTERTGNLDEAMVIMSSTDDCYRYSVAWIDLTSRGSRLGRAVLTRGEHARLDQISAHQGRQPRRPPGDSRLSVPPWVPPGLLNRATVRTFNEVWYRKAWRERSAELVPFGSFFHPLDGIRDWNHGYGAAGFVQYQLVVPFGAEAVLAEILDRITQAGSASLLSVLKRFGAAAPGPLSFPMPGWTLALDLPARPEAAPLLDVLDTLVIDAGGRVYLAKDARARSGTVAAMYPRLDEFRAACDELDPIGVFQSDLARRLELRGAVA